MRIQATLLVLLALVGACAAQLKVTLRFHSAAQREVFVATALPKQPPQQVTKASGASLDYAVPAFGPEDRIYVWDLASNNIASRAIREISNGTWEVRGEDYTLLGLVTVRIEHKGRPVQAAKVILSTKAKKEEQLLDPADKGDLQFFGFPAGDMKVSVSYDTVTKQSGSQEQTFTIHSKRDRAEPVLNIALPEDVATQDPSGIPAAAGGAKPSATGSEANADQGNPVGRLIFFVVALGIVLGIGYWILHMMKSNPKAFEEKLTKLGVQIPKPQDPADAEPVPVQPIAPAPPPKIVLEDSAPAPLTGSPVAAAVTPLVREPALVRDSGERFMLTEGEAMVGRDAGLTLSLTKESTVSRRHASITVAGAEAVLRDLGSTNGTFVNGARLQGETVLRPGDQVQFGEVRFRYEG